MGSMYSRSMDGLLVLRLFGVVIAAIGVGTLVANLRRPSTWASPTRAWDTRHARLVLAVGLIVMGVLIALAAVQLAG